jgi:hypothetical protein
MDLPLTAHRDTVLPLLPPCVIWPLKWAHAIRKILASCTDETLTKGCNFASMTPDEAKAFRAYFALDQKPRIPKGK